MYALIALLALSSQAHAVTHKPLDAAALRAQQITVRTITGKMAGAIYGVKWNEDGKSCEATQNARATEKLVWQTIDPKGCEQLREFVLAHAQDLADSANSAEKSKKHVPFQKTMGQLLLSDYRIAVNLNTQARCDVNMENCVEPKLSTASQLALLLRTVTTEELGRLSRPAR